MRREARLPWAWKEVPVLGKEDPTPTLSIRCQFTGVRAWGRGFFLAFPDVLFQEKDFGSSCCFHH